VTQRPKLKLRQRRLPATLETDAQQYAHDWIVQRLQGDFWELGAAPMDQQAGHALVRRLFKHYAASDKQPMLIVLELAYAGIEDARLALVELILEYSAAHLPTPALLEEFHTRLLTGRMPAKVRGQSKASHVLQDLAIAVLIGELAARFGLQPTHHRLARRQRSACGVAAQELGKLRVRTTTEANLAKIWARYAPIVKSLMNHNN
jgi:hypothetical protein